MLAPAVPELTKEFKSTNQELASFVVSVYILGYAFGPITIAPLSELYGRVPVYHVCNILFIVFTIACAVSTNFNMLIGWRFLQGTFGSCPLTIGGGTISDMIIQEKRGGVMAIWALGPLMGPVIGPVAGGYLAQAKGWRWIFWVIAMAVSSYPHPRQAGHPNNGTLGGRDYNLGLLLPPRIISSHPPRTQGNKATERDGQRKPQIQIGVPSEPSGTLQNSHRSAHEAALSVTYCSGAVNLHGCSLWLSISTLYHDYGGLPKAVSF